MLFLVSGEWVEVGALLPPEQVVQVLDQIVLPSLELLAEWEQQGRIHGGILVGERAGTFTLEAASHEEAGQLLSSLPFWGYVKWQVRPLQSVRSAAERERQVSVQIKSQLPQGR